MSLDKALAHVRDGADTVIETSCATVILKGDKAYKLKKSVDYGFLDFTTPEKRREALRRELQFNQRTAADIYHHVEEVYGETVLVMRRFDHKAVLSALADTAPDDGLMRDLGYEIAQFHASSDICTDVNHLNNIKYVIDSNTQNISKFRHVLGAEAVDAYEAAVTSAYLKVADSVEKRFRDGFVRHCHGDLHLGNILIEHNRPVLFDCIEFNDRLSQIDVLYDLAFLLMDVSVRGHRAAASQVLNVWLAQSARHADDPQAIYAGLSLLPLYMSMRAAVRCHVNANYGGEAGYGLGRARDYLKAALGFLDDQPPQLMAIGGLSGAGKSTRARVEAPRIGSACGAVILRSDEIRKRLWGCDEYAPLPEAAYAPADDVRVYSHMFDLAQTLLASGQSVILDATFRQSALRQRCADLAQTVHVPFQGLWLDVPAHERQLRIAARRKDVSDATPDIALKQQGIDLSDISWHIEQVK
ncbi:MAG: AAA family ATPase [Asticcacaulis sp.]